MYSRHVSWEVGELLFQLVVNHKDRKLGAGGLLLGLGQLGHLLIDVLLQFRHGVTRIINKK